MESRIGLPEGSLLLPLPMSVSLSLSLCLSHKLIRSFLKRWTEYKKEPVRDEEFNTWDAEERTGNLEDRVMESNQAEQQKEK